MATIGRTRNGLYVLDKYNSRNEIPAVLIREALSKVHFEESTWMLVSVPFTEVVGYSVVVPASSNEEVFYAKRTGHDFLSRFVKNKLPIATHLITVELSRIRSTQELLLNDSYFGDKREAEIEYTDDNTPTVEQIKFWNSHAWCFGYISVTPGTVTEICPWEP